MPSASRLELVLSSHGDYSRSALREVPAGLPDGLTRLDLSHNELAELSPLGWLGELTELRLADNLLSSPALHRSGPLPPALRLLDLSSNRLVALPPAVLRLSSLLLLQLGGQRLRMLPRQLSQLAALVQLEAQNNELTEALVLDEPGLPQLRRLNLCGNRLRELRLSAGGAVPCLTDLDLGSNSIKVWPDALSKLPGLRRLSLENNGLTSLRSTSSLPNRRIWMPTSAIHQLSELSQLNLARNSLSALPLEIQQLKHLDSLDLRCNPLDDESISLIRLHCEAISARLSLSSLSQLFAGIVVGDRTAAWHHPTLLRNGITAVVSIAPLPVNGVEMSRLATRYGEELAMLGLSVSQSTGASADAQSEIPQGHEEATMCFSTLDEAPKQPLPMCTAHASSRLASDQANLSLAELKKAFHTAALRCHPDKRPVEEREAATSHFAKLRDAYKRLATALQVEARALPNFPNVSYHLIDVAEEQLPVLTGSTEQVIKAIDALEVDNPIGERSTSATSQHEGDDQANDALALCERLGAAAMFMAEAASSDGTILLHPGELSSELARPLTSALLHIYLVLTGETLGSASRRIDAAAGPPFIASAAFDGWRHGYTFRSGASGIGYYREGGDGAGHISGGLTSLPSGLCRALQAYSEVLARRAHVVEEEEGARDAGIVDHHTASSAVGSDFDYARTFSLSSNSSAEAVKVITVQAKGGQAFSAIVEHAPGARLEDIDGSCCVRSTAVG